MILGEKIREELPALELGEIESFELFRTGTRTRPSERPRRAQTIRTPDPLEDVQSLDGFRQSTSEQPTEEGVHRKDLQISEPPRDPRIIKRRPNRSRDQAPPPPQKSTAAPQNARPMAAAVKSSAATREPIESETDASRPEIGTEEINLVAELAKIDQKVKAEDVVDARPDAKNRRPRVPPPPPDADELPTPEAYDRLVSEYRQSKQPRVREEVVRKLEEDSISEHTVIRYYAVEAMSKLGRDVFGTALLAATEDENEAVRAIAVEALRR
jgi:hypothetical protein